MRPARRRRPPRPGRRSRRAGLSLLELVLAGTLAAAVTGSLHVVLRGVRTATTELSGEHDVLRHADAGLRFMVRRCRQARGVLECDPAGGSLRVDVGGGESLRFFRAPFGGGFVLNVQDTAAGENRTFMDHLTTFTPTLYEPDGVTPTTDPAAAGMIELTLTVDLPRDHAAGRTVSSRVWVRRW